MDYMTGLCTINARKTQIKIHSETSLQLQQKAETEQLSRGMMPRVGEELKRPGFTLLADATPIQLDSYES